MIRVIGMPIPDINGACLLASFTEAVSRLPDDMTLEAIETANGVIDIEASSDSLKMATAERITALMRGIFGRESIELSWERGKLPVWRGVWEKPPTQAGAVIVLTVHGDTPEELALNLIKAAADAKNAIETHGIKANGTGDKYEYDACTANSEQKHHIHIGACKAMDSLRS